MSIENLENIDICIIVLIVLLILAILIILYLYSKYKKLKAQLNILQYEYRTLQNENNWYETEKKNLESKNRDLIRKNDELEKLHTPIADALLQKNIEPSKSSEKESETKKKNAEVKDVTMYASFPRSAGSSVYFSDLTLILEDDSFFELKISKDKKTAAFKPLDFMKIRNYDPAMIAMQTEGVKPNVASAVLGIESGKAHKEGSDWIIDNPAKIKLA